MAKDKFERTKPHVNVGTIGHHMLSMRVRLDIMRMLIVLVMLIMLRI